MPAGLWFLLALRARIRSLSPLWFLLALFLWFCLAQTLFAGACTCPCGSCLLFSCGSCLRTHGGACGHCLARYRSHSAARSLPPWRVRSLAGTYSARPPSPVCCYPLCFPLVVLVPPLFCPPPLASLVRTVGGARWRPAPPPRRVTARPFAPSCLCWVSFSPLRPFVWFLLVVPVCSLVPCGASAVPARRSLRFPFRRGRSAVRSASRSAPFSPLPRRGFPSVRLPSVFPRLRRRAVSFLAVRLCSWRGFAPLVFRCLRRFLHSCFHPFSISAPSRRRHRPRKGGFKVFFWLCALLIKPKVS